jgi:hypothetical protein
MLAVFIFNSGLEPNAVDRAPVGCNKYFPPVDGLWLSLVERLVRDEEAVGSNPTSPRTFRRRRNHFSYELRT